MGFGKGAEGTNGNGFQLLVIIFIELFGVSLGQLVAALSPSIRVRSQTLLTRSRKLMAARSPYYLIHS